MQGRCTCGEIRFRLKAKPMFVHCCHCTWCQRETGSAFAINAMIEAEEVELESGVPEEVLTPSESGRGQLVSRCPKCRVAVWSVYSGAGPAIRFVRVGTLEDPGALTPDVHIFTESKLPWVVLPQDARAFPQYYRLEEEWPVESRERRKAAKARYAARDR
ncbi:GFA family protein [Oricola thermophila]|nr:GFA family protein [Oricola thermophila]